MSIYCDLHSPWQRGTHEYKNGFVKGFFNLIMVNDNSRVVIVKKSLMDRI